jgi:hypothetical protein
MEMRERGRKGKGYFFIDSATVGPLIRRLLFFLVLKIR